MRDGTAIHSGKIFKSCRRGVKILDCRTMVWRFVANTWYNELTKPLKNES